MALSHTKILYVAEFANQPTKIKGNFKDKSTGKEKTARVVLSHKEDCVGEGLGMGDNDQSRTNMLFKKVQKDIQVYMAIIDDDNSSEKRKNTAREFINKIMTTHSVVVEHEDWNSFISSIHQCNNICCCGDSLASKYYIPDKEKMKTFLLADFPKESKLFLNKSIAFYGGSGCGKTTCILDVLTIIGSELDAIHVYCGTMMSNNVYENYVLPHQIKPNLDIQDILNIIQTQQAKIKFAETFMYNVKFIREQILMPLFLTNGFLPTLYNRILMLKNRNKTSSFPISLMEIARAEFLSENETESDFKKMRKCCGSYNERFKKFGLSIPNRNRNFIIGTAMRIIDHFTFIDIDQVLKHDIIRHKIENSHALPGEAHTDTERCKLFSTEFLQHSINKLLKALVEYIPDCIKMVLSHHKKLEHYVTAIEKVFSSIGMKINVAIVIDDLTPQLKESLTSKKKIDYTSPPSAAAINNNNNDDNNNNSENVFIARQMVDNNNNNNINNINNNNNDDNYQQHQHQQQQQQQQVNNPIEDLFYKARHNKITFILVSHDMTAVPVGPRQNVMINFFCDELSFNRYFGSRILADIKEKQTVVSNYITHHNKDLMSKKYKKIIYFKDMPRAFYTFKATLHQRGFGDYLVKNDTAMKKAKEERFFQISQRVKSSEIYNF